VEQLVFELAPPEPPRFANFLPGRNVELVAALMRFARGTGNETGFFIWGAAAAGKTHLLRAALALAEEGRTAAQLVAEPRVLDGRPPVALMIVDRIDEADEGSARRLFTLYNALRERGGRLLAAGRTPPALLAVREDLRTRLGWGLVYEALPLADEEKPAALAAYARQRGYALSSEVIEYLLRHAPRDMPSLLSALAALDRVSLAQRRPVSVALAREWLRREPWPAA
jgi:DnaA-homolog protein